MSWTRERIDNQLYNFFSFYSKNGVGGADGSISEEITGGDAGETEHFRITELRMHCSIAIASTEDQDLIVHLTAKQGAAHNITFLSQAVNGIVDFLWTPDEPLQFVSGDTLSVWLSVNSGTSEIGLNVQGWAVAS